MGSSHKGSGFERDLCRKLSEWWTFRQDDDVFWRTASSGGRATIRGRKGKRSAGQYGDITATDDRGLPLLRWLVIEAKRGYSYVDILGMLDSRKARHEILQFIDQAQSEARLAQVPYWWIVFKRDAKAPIIFMLWDVYTLAGKSPSCGPRPERAIRFLHEGSSIIVIKLEDWFNYASPHSFLGEP